MAFDDDVAERVRRLLHEQEEFFEKAMFGGLAFMVGDHMAVALGANRTLMVRVSRDGMDAALARGAQRMQMGERTMNGFVVVAVDELDDADLDAWIGVGVGVASSLPPKN